MATKLNTANIAALRAASLSIGGADKMRAFGVERKRSFEECTDGSVRDALDLNRVIDTILEEDEDEDEGLDEASTRSVKEVGPANCKLVRGYSIGTTGFQHLRYDIHAKHQLDLHDALVHDKKKKGTEDQADVSTPDQWLKKLVSERKQVASPTMPASAAAAAPKVDSVAGKAWALMRQAAMAATFLKTLEAAKEAGKLDEKSEASLRELSQKLQPPAGMAVPGFDVQAYVEQAFMAQANAGELSDLFSTVTNAYLPQQPIVDPAQMFLMQQQLAAWEQQQQYLMQLQMQQQQLHQQMQQQQQLQEQMRQQELYQQEQMRQQQLYHHQQQMQRFGGAPQYYGQRSPQYYNAQQPPPPQQQQMAPALSPPRSPPKPAAAGALPPAVPGRLVEMAYTKEGSQALQRQLHSMSPARLQEACDELAPQLAELSFDTFGNYLVSNMATLPQMQPAITAALRSRVVELATHAQGSRVLQVVCEALPVAMVSSLVGELEGFIAEVASKTYGSWSVCTAYRATHAPFILSEVAAAVGHLSTLQDGSRVVQRVLPEAAGHGADVSVVLDALIALGGGLGRLAADSFGNYVVQVALRVVDGDAERRRQLVELLLPCLPALSTSKAGSNAAEAVLGYLAAEQIPEARRLLLGPFAYDLNRDRYGQHVVAALHRRAAAVSTC